MKIIHTADIHLDSPLVGVADAKVRRTELLRALFNMSEYAKNNDVSAILMAGDLFDDKFVSETTVRSVADIINGGKAVWFIIRGNHGDATPYARLKSLCPRAVFFGEDWQTFSMGTVAVTSRELGANDADVWQKLSLNPSVYNILMLHGDIDDPSYGLIDKKVIAAQPINYVALGHRHSFAKVSFGKVKGCYCGVLEARGFDEAESTGFVVIDTDFDKITFVRQHIRAVENLQTDVSGICTDLALETRILNDIANVSPQNYLNFRLVGTLEEGVRPLAVAENILRGKFFALRICDCTKPKTDLAKLKEEVSLRGEFVKLAMQLEDDEFREQVLKTGLAALAGEL